MFLLKRLPRALLAGGALLLPLTAVEAAYTLTTGMLAGADEDVREQSPGETSGGRTFLELRSRNIAGSERHRVAFFRFDLTGIEDAIEAATLRFWIASSTVDSDSVAIDVFGVVDGVSTEADWSASSLSYNNAPGFTGGDYPDIDRDHGAGEVVHLGSINYPGGSFSGELTFSSQALLDLLNADTNNGVTLFLELQEASDGEDFSFTCGLLRASGVTPETSRQRSTFRRPSLLLLRPRRRRTKSSSKKRAVT